MKIYALAAVLLALCAVSCAQVRDAPNVTVVFLSNGAPYYGQVWASYNCTGPYLPNAYKYEKDVPLTCRGAVCMNTEWFYLPNACTHPDKGHIEYRLEDGNGTKSTGNVPFPDSGTYRVDVDVNSGAVNVSKLDLCPLSLGAIVLVLGLYARNKIR